MYPMQTPQLPPGWEKKWDPNQRKFFYINHHTKTTQWDPPQFAAYPPKPVNQQFSYQQGGFQQNRPQSSTTTSFNEADQTKVKILLDEFNGLTKDLAETLLKQEKNKIYSVKTMLKEMGYEYKKKEVVTPKPETGPDKYKVEAIIGEYRDVSKGFVETILKRVNNDATEAKKILDDMGYKKDAESYSDNESSVTSSFKEEIEADENKVKMLVEKYDGVSHDLVRKLLSSNNNDENKVSSEIADRGYKERLQPKQLFVEVLVKEFSNLLEGTAKDVLVSSKNDLAKARSSLKNMGYKLAADEKPKQKPTPKKKDLSNKQKNERVRDLKKRYPKIPEKLVRMALMGTNYDVPNAIAVLDSSVQRVEKKSTSTAEVSIPKSNLTVATDNIAPVAFSEDDPSTSFKETSFDENTPKKTPKKVVKNTTPKANQKYKPRPRNVVNYNQKYTSSRSLALGPNPGNVVGANPNLLSQNYTQAHGPNKANAQGPNRSLRVGPCRSNLYSQNLAIGSSNLAKGPGFINKGPMAAFV